MITDSCGCYGRAGHGCKGCSRSQYCPMCDRNKVRRRCQSEGLYQEGDPLKELNWCCDRGCDLFNRSSKCSQNKKTDLEMNEKKNNCPDDIGMDGGDNCYSHIKKHHSKTHKEKHGIEKGFNNYNHDSNEGDLSRCMRTPKHEDKSRPHLPYYENYKYHSIGDYPGTISSNCKSYAFVDKDKTSANIRERYIKEMEVLRCKLSLLKDEMVMSDGKRLRQRSESEPGFAELPGGVPKRARDNSPKMRMGCRKLPASPTVNQSLHRFPVKQNTSFQRESKSLSPSSLKHHEKNVLHKSSFSKSFIAVKKSMKELNEDDEDQEASTCDEDVQNKDDIDANSEDDDGSIQSIVTSGSSDSNTPSKVGETLSSITLSDVSKKDVVQSRDNNHPKLESVPENEGIHDKHLLLNDKSLFRNSLFPNVPPYVKFHMHDLKGPTLPAEITKHLKWKLSSITPIVVRRTLLNSGFKLVRRGTFDQYYHFIYVTPQKGEDSQQTSQGKPRPVPKLVKESNDWTGQWGKHMKSFVFKTLKDFQKLNHFPGTFQIGRKDRLWKNLYRLMVKFGKKEFGFIPKTYILPHDRKSLRTAWEKHSGLGKGQWIVKPPAAARGTGIKVVHKWGQIPKKKSLIVQKYIAQPYLINGSKFDLRLYVLMTSIHPLRIYLYDDGLVRFASVKYSEDVECLSNRFMHLTNYSINKLSTQYQVNADASSCHGHKWSLKSLWTYLSKEGINVKALRKNLTDLVIKTIISGESNINVLSKNNLPSRYCSYELFGIDVLLDSNLKPWLLEVNISPSLHSASPLDLAVKGPLVKELLNIAGFQIPAKLTKEQEEIFLDTYSIKDKTHTLCYDRRLYWTVLSKEERAKQEYFNNLSREEYLNTILGDLTPDDIRHLIQFEDELTQIKRFEKIFPTTQTHIYHQFFESPRYYNMMLDAWETKYKGNRAEGVRRLSGLCRQKLHLNVPFPGGKAKSSVSLNEINSQSVPVREAESDSEPEKEEEAEPEPEPEPEPEKEPEPDKKKPSKPSPSPPPPPLPSQRGLSKAKPGVVSKPAVFSNHVATRRPKAPKPTCDVTADPRLPLDGNCFKMLAEMQQNGIKFGSEPSKLKQYPSCKLENSLMGESLSGGKSVLSPSKHIHNSCIKMNTSS